MDALTCLTKHGDADGQAVWFWLPDAGVKFAGWRCRPSVRHAAQAMVAKKPGTPGRARSSRKTIAQGVPSDFGVPVLACVRLFRFARKAVGAFVHPAFPAPSVWRDEVVAKPGRKSRRGNAEACSLLSSRASEHLAARSAVKSRARPGTHTHRAMCCAKPNPRVFAQPNPVVMGPCFRRDDTE
jgi:hypothetical protein